MLPIHSLASYPELQQIACMRVAQAAQAREKRASKGDELAQTTHGTYGNNIVFAAVPTMAPCNRCGQPGPVQAWKRVECANVLQPSRQATA